MKKISIAITGGIGSGKSTVSKILQEKGFNVFSCDEIYNELFYSEEFQKILCKEFPSINENGKISKAALGKYVFSNKEQLSRLNKLSHSAILSILKEKIDETSNGIVFSEVPLLFENNYEDNFDFIVVVQRKKSDRVEAVAKRDNLTKEDVYLRMERQWDYESERNKKYLKNDRFFIIENNYSIDHLKKQIDVLINLFKSETLFVKQ